jgi:hypothetical protein
LLFSICPELTQSHIQWTPVALSLSVKRPGHETDHSPPTSAEAKITWSYTSTVPYVFIAQCLVKLRDNFLHFSAYFTVLYIPCINILFPDEGCYCNTIEPHCLFCWNVGRTKRKCGVAIPIS